MSPRPHESTRAGTVARVQGFARHVGSEPLMRRFPGTDMATGLILLLVALGVPRTILEDLDVVAPESGLLYYFLALTPFAIWLAVGIARRSCRPLADFLVVGILYGLSLVVIHQALWSVGPSLAHHPPASAVDFADQFGPGWRGVALRGYTSGIAMMIGVGSGVVVGLVALAAGLWRSKSRAQDGSSSDA
jgi:hypothetical protein